MAPFLATLISRDSNFNPSTAADEFRDQWIQPGDVFSVLLILGGDVIARALAQVTGSGLATVAFSFGWVAYAISALVSAVGENKLMALDPDCKCKVINGKSGYAKDNSSWIMGRIVRDFDHWRDQLVEDKLQEVLETRHEKLKEKDADAPRPPMAGLVVSIYEPSRQVTAGTVERDRVYSVGIPVMVFQLGIAAIPCGIWGDWGILLITACGIGLSIATGLLPQWKKEKWACRKESEHSYILTRGSGAQHAIVILGNGRGFNLEDLASGQSNVLVATNTGTRVALLVLAALWIFLLISAAGLKANTWFLLAVGGIGILQNIYVAGAPRRPENFGIPIDYVNVFGNPSGMKALLEVEKHYPGIGFAMRKEFFPGELREGEQEEWDDLKKEAKAAKEAKEKKEAEEKNAVGEQSGK